MTVLEKMAILEGERLFLRILNEEDVTEQYCAWINDPDPFGLQIESPHPDHQVRQPFNRVNHGKPALGPQ